MTTITISKSKIEKQKGIIVLPLKEYEKLLARAVPAYYLQGKEAKKLDKLVEQGLKEYRSGKTIEADSLSAALKIYRKKHAN